MILLKTKLTLGSRKYLLPGSHLLPMTACSTRRFRRYSTMCSRDYVPSLLQFTSIDKSLWITTYTYRSYCPPQLLLLLQDVLKYSSIFREFFTLTALQFLAAWIPLRIITRACRVSAHPQLFLCFTKVFKIIFDLPKILWSLWLLNFLFAFIMINPISIEILLTFLVIIILSLLTQYVANARNHQLILLNYLSGSDVFQTWAGSRPNYLSSIVPLVYSIDPSLIRTSVSDPLLWKS